LAVYKAAVVARFYTDWDGTGESTDTQVLAWLPAVDETAGGAAYPFTTEERQRLERCREAVAAGYYSDDLPTTSTTTEPQAEPDTDTQTGATSDE
jgi:hypothetical protein